jgi:polyribonucleotide nucleotidyltransferase
MATVCAGSMALMDAGIQLKKMVSGIAMGLIADTASGKYAVLSDILGDADHLGDMDFKVTGTKDGITACQMDIKVDGLSYDVLAEALAQAKQGRIHIMDEMSKTISNPREDYKDFVPRIEKLIIPKDKIGAVIGSGGKVINKIIEMTGVKIDIDEDGTVYVSTIDSEAGDKAVNIIKGITSVVEPGMVFTGAKVVKIMNFGAFVEFLPGKDGLVHISQLAHERVGKVEDVCKVGDLMDVKVLEVDRQGRIGLSRKAMIERPNAAHKEQPEQKV